MKKAILTTKVGMTQVFSEDGVLTPVTVLQAGPCVVTQVKTVENDGYSAVQVGFGDIREKLVNKPKKGHFAKAGVTAKRFLKEFRLEDAESYTLGQEIKADVFAAGDKVKASRVQSRDMDSPEDLWLMVPNITDMQVLTDQQQLRAVYSKANICQVTWVQ